MILMLINVGGWVFSLVCVTFILSLHIDKLHDDVDKLIERIEKLEQRFPEVS